MRHFDQPRVVGYGDTILPGDEYRVGVLVRPDETDMFTFIGHKMSKTISWMRLVSMSGKATLGGEFFRSTSDWSGTIDPLRQMLEVHKKAPTLDIELTLKVTDRPIIFFEPNSTSRSYSNDGEYLDVPYDWINITDKAGERLFDKYLVGSQNTSYEQPSINEQLRDELVDYRFNAKEEKHIAWSSERTIDENIKIWDKVCEEFGYKFKRESFERLIEEYQNELIES